MTAAASLREKIERGEPADALTELMARAYATDWDSADESQRIWWRLKSLDVRAAIEASGTHVVVPVEPARCLRLIPNTKRDTRPTRVAEAYRAMIAAARPKP